MATMSIEDQENAAIKIQSAFRGMKARDRVKAMKTTDVTVNINNGCQGDRVTVNRDSGYYGDVSHKNWNTDKAD